MPHTTPHHTTPHHTPHTTPHATHHTTPHHTTPHHTPHHMPHITPHITPHIMHIMPHFTTPHIKSHYYSAMPHTHKQTFYVNWVSKKPGHLVTLLIWTLVILLFLFYISLIGSSFFKGSSSPPNFVFEFLSQLQALILIFLTF
jgi:hypothetical protein